MARRGLTQQWCRWCLKNNKRRASLELRRYICNLMKLIWTSLICLSLNVSILFKSHVASSPTLGTWLMLPPPPKGLIFICLFKSCYALRAAAKNDHPIKPSSSNEGCGLLSSFYHLKLFHEVTKPSSIAPKLGNEHENRKNRVISCQQNGMMMRAPNHNRMTRNYTSKMSITRGEEFDKPHL